MLGPATPPLDLVASTPKGQLKKPDKPHPRRIALGELDASITRQRAQLGQRTVQSSNPRAALIAQEAAISGGASS